MCLVWNLLETPEERLGEVAEYDKDFEWSFSVESMLTRELLWFGEDEEAYRVDYG